MDLFSMKEITSEHNTLAGKHGRASFYGVQKIVQTVEEEATKLAETKFDKADLSPNFIAKIVNTINLYNTTDPTNINIDAFAELAKSAQIVANLGNIKPKILVEIMARYVAEVEGAVLKGKKFAGSCLEAKEVASKVLKDYKQEQIPDSVLSFSNRWDYLAAQTGRGDKKLMESITPERNMPKTSLTVKVDAVDIRDMMEFLRKNWRKGNKAYRIVEHGKGLMGHLSYWRQELLPDYWFGDIYNRKQCLKNNAFSCLFV